MVELLQVMPLSGFLLSKLLNLPSYYAAGLILVGCCPGGMYVYQLVFIFRFHPHSPCLGIYIDFFVAGTASNIVTYIARFVNSPRIVKSSFCFSFVPEDLTTFLVVPVETWRSQC